MVGFGWEACMQWRVFAPITYLLDSALKLSARVVDDKCLLLNLILRRAVLSAACTTNIKSTDIEFRDEKRSQPC